MASTPPVLVISSQGDPPSKSTPHLMPFHVAYTGPAPISTYFRVREAPEPTYGRDVRPPPTPLITNASQLSTDSQATLVASTVTSMSSVATLDSPSATQDLTIGETSTPSIVDHRHFAAAFRGRSMHGTKIDLPTGYAGVVLQALDKDKGKGVASEDGWRSKEKPESKGRSTRFRWSKRTSEPVRDEDEEMELSEDHNASEGGPIHTLRPVLTFSSFVLWHPDIPVDEGRDEYLRSLTEWTKLAGEVHRVEEC